MKERWRRGPPCGCGLGSARGTPPPWPFRLLASRWSCFRALFDISLVASRNTVAVGIYDPWMCGLAGALQWLQTIVFERLRLQQCESHARGYKRGLWAAV